MYRVIHDSNGQVIQAEFETMNQVRKYLNDNEDILVYDVEERIGQGWYPHHGIFRGVYSNTSGTVSVRFFQRWKAFEWAEANRPCELLKHFEGIGWRSIGEFL